MQSHFNDGGCVATTYIVCLRIGRHGYAVRQSSVPGVVNRNRER